MGAADDVRTLTFSKSSLEFDRRLLRGSPSLVALSPPSAAMKADHRQSIEDNLFLKKGSSGWTMRFVVIDGERRTLSYRFQQDDDVERFVIDLRDWKVFKGVRNGH